VKNKSEYVLESVLLESERLNAPVELRNMVTDIDLYEHLDKPYLTAQVLLIDNERLYENADILGAERITIKIKSIRDNTKAIENYFYIKKVIFDEKSGDRTQIISLQLVEDIGFISNLININKAYTGKPSKIIEKVAREYLDCGFEINGKETQGDFNVIIPNLNPVETIQWLTQRASTVRGYPFYTFSTMAFNKLYMVDLGTMLEAPVLNPNISYKYNQTANNSPDEDVKRRVIKGYRFSNNSEDLSQIIGKGLIGAKYNFIDTIDEVDRTIKFDIQEDLFKQMADDGLLKQQPNVPFSDKYTHNGKSFNKMQTETISMLRSSGAFREAPAGFESSFGESYLAADYKLEIVSRAMDNILKKSVLTIVVPGLDFIDGDKHSTIGNKIRVEFQHTQADQKKSSKNLDTKKSGDYLIYNVRHQFKKEKYDAVLGLVKIGNLKRWFQKDI